MNFFGLIFVLLTTLMIGGCSVRIPTYYVRSEHPYQHRFYASYEKVLKASDDILQERGWAIVRHGDPALYDQTKVLADPDRRQLIIFAKKKTSLLGQSRKLDLVNVIITEVSKVEVLLEVRLLLIDKTFYKEFRTFRDDDRVKSFFQEMESRL